MDKAAPSISIIIPVLNEAARINTLLTHLKAIIRENDAEVIVVDGGSSDGSLTAITDPDVIKRRSSRGRGLQMNQGAKAARGDTLLFLHCDTFPPPNAIQSVRAALDDHAIVAGAFDLGIQSNHPSFKLITLGASLRTRITRIPYGDQAIFIRKKNFKRLDGYRDIPLMEDVELMRRIKKKGWNIKILPEKVMTSPRRWQKEGVLYGTLRNWTLVLLYYAGVSPARLSRFYRF